MLQSIAYSYGNWVPVVASTNGPHDYEQVAAPVIRHANRTATPGSWDAFDLNPESDTVVALS